MNSPRNLIKLNPSQELCLRKTAQMPQGVFATPLLCPIADLSREDFLSIKKFSIYKMQNAVGVYFFPCLLQLPERTMRAAFLCGAGVQQQQDIDAGGASGGYRFSLQDFLEKAGGIIFAAESFLSDDNFLFNATSFKMCRIEISGNSYKLYDEVWKKINEKD